MIGRIPVLGQSTYPKEGVVAGTVWYRVFRKLGETLQDETQMDVPTGIYEDCGVQILSADREEAQNDFASQYIGPPSRFELFPFLTIDEAESHVEALGKVLVVQCGIEVEA